MADLQLNQNSVPLPVARRTNCESHGGKGTGLYKVWEDLKRRCSSPKRKGYKNYGGRGITVSKEWADSFIAFRDWAISAGYKKGLEIDRRDNNGNYNPENCRFVTSSQNKINRRKPIGGSSIYRGVSYDSDRKSWRAQIAINGQRKRIGRFSAQLPAALSYDDAAFELHGEYAMLNFPERKMPKPKALS